MTATQCIPALRALGEETRQRLLNLLAREQLTVTEIVERLSLPQYTVSKHLRVLREAGLLDLERSGRERRYSLNSRWKQTVQKKGVLDLGCCSFRLQKRK